MATTTASKEITEDRIYHISGHALLAMNAGFPIELLSVNGFSVADLSRISPRAQRLDEWTMIRMPELQYPPGTFPHTRLMENLCHLALAGPILELLHRGRPCTVSAIKEHEHDWRQAWTAAGFLHHDETERVAYLDRQIALGERYISLPSWQEYIGPITRHLSTNGTMEGSDLQAIWDRIKVEHEARSRRPVCRQRIVFEIDDDVALQEQLEWEAMCDEEPDME